ncbi:hypothetical protein M6D93_08565 [Jatrophihabitans telluris]|uniref:Twin-arginine translocation signal domain-containing protein n=1 Tax=Jatrophihabitans telluris TaxID=2038343 RepID=A0ABY4R288_9ACTN|nr:hypothetical protein [Jatrophihabitans telluris]UQX90041.1 hypothetical protein M6D93_08565 [Jatrophihabitans telluris]
MVEISRRTLLGRTVLGVGVLAGAGLGLTKSVHHRVAVAPPLPPLALRNARAVHDRLLAGYDRALAAGGSSISATALKALKADVTAQRDALSAVLDQYPGWRYAQRGDASAGSARPSPGPSSGAAPAGGAGSGPPVAGTATALAAASRQAAAALRTSTLDWPAGADHSEQTLALFGSIAAALTVHAQVLR